MTALVAVLAGSTGLFAGVLANRAAGRFPWSAHVRFGELAGPGRTAVRSPWVEAATAALFALVALRFGPSVELAAFLVLAATAVLLTLIDLRYRLLPDRIVLPAIAVGAALLLIAAAAGGTWPALLRAGMGAVVLFVAFLVLALLAPGGLGMGDVKLAGLLGLHLGWLGWEEVAFGAAAGFVVQAVVALALLATRRIGLSGELPFGPAMLAGAALAIGGADVAVAHLLALPA